MCLLLPSTPPFGAPAFLSLAMPEYEIQKPYRRSNLALPQTLDVSDDFEIDPDLSDEDAQELLQEFKNLDPQAVSRELADATLDLQRAHWDKWSRYEDGFTKR